MLYTADLFKRLEASKSQIVPLPRVAAALAAQTGVIEALIEVISEQNDRLAAMEEFLGELGAAAPKPKAQEPVSELELGWATDVASGERHAPMTPPPPASPAPQPGVEHRPRPQVTSELGSPTFTSTRAQPAGELGVHMRQSGQHASAFAGVTPSEDLNLHAGVVTTGPAHPPTVPPPSRQMTVTGPGAPGTSGVQFSPAAPPIDSNTGSIAAREPIVEMHPAEPENRTDSTVAFSPAEPAIEATPVTPELTSGEETP